MSWYSTPTHKAEDCPKLEGGYCSNSTWRKPIHCGICQVELHAERSDRAYCGSACKQKAYRLRKKAERAAAST